MNGFTAQVLAIGEHKTSTSYKLEWGPTPGAFSKNATIQPRKLRGRARVHRAAGGRNGRQRSSGLGSKLPLEAGSRAALRTPGRKRFPARSRHAQFAGVVFGGVSS